jgi:hypothetical protein
MSSFKSMSQSKIYFTTGGLSPISLSWRQAPLKLTTNSFFFQLNTWIHSSYVTPTLTRGLVCSLRFLLGLASAVILRYESRGTHGHIWHAQIRDSPILEGQVLIYIYPPGTGWPGFTPKHSVPFSSPPITRRAEVEVFDPASTRAAKSRRIG